MPSANGLRDHLVTDEIVVADVFVANRKILHAKRLRVSHCRATCAPLGRRRAVGELDEVAGVLRYGVHLRTKGHHLNRLREVAARHACRNDRNRLCSETLAQQKVLVEAKSEIRGVSPEV